jgi:predicted transcriptional regulator
VKVNEDSSLQRRRENRTRIDVMTCILRKSQIPTRKTQIMYSCGLSSKQAAYLPGVLRFDDLIEKDDEPRICQQRKKDVNF